MKIGLDYHGVLNKNPAFFAKFCKKAVANGIKICILSGSPKTELEAYLKENKIEYAELYSLLDDFKSRQMVRFDEDGRFYVPDEIWDRAKARYCMQEKIDLHIDDSPIYGSYFQTPFCLYSDSEKKCTFIRQKIDIDFSKSPEAVLEDIIQKIKDS